MLELVFRLSVMVFMVGSLGSVGMALTPNEAVAPLKNLRFGMLSLLVSWLVCPLVALAVLAVVPLAEPYATGLMLVALAPCAPFVPAVVKMANGDAAYVAAFILLSAVSTVIIMPIELPLLVRGLQVDAMLIARPLLLFVLAPLLIGLAIKVWLPQQAESLRTAAARATNIAGLVAVVLMAILHGRGVIDAVGSLAIASQVVYIGATTVAAHLCGAALPDEQRTVLTLGTCTRNLGAALAPLIAVHADPRAIVMVVIAAPVTVFMSAMAAKWIGRHPSAAHRSAGIA